MQFTGELEAMPLVRFCISDEWQFEIHWDYLPKTPMVRCMFHKGTYLIGKYLNGDFVEHFELGDFFSGIVDCENPTLRGVLQHFIETAEPSKNPNLRREDDADVIIKTIEIWVGKMKDVSRIIVLQPYRNGSFSSHGEVALHPDLPCK